MASRSKHSQPASQEVEWVQDVLELRPVSAAAKRLATGLTILSCILYSGLFFLVWAYRLQVADHIRDFPIFTRIVLNIAQPFLVVFVIVSVSLWILWRLKIRSANRSSTPLLAMIIVNSVVAVILPVISYLVTVLTGL